MDNLVTIKDLENEWELETGFFGKLRLGSFDPIGLDRVVRIIKSIELKNASMIDRRLVSLTWYIPLFMNWQRERFLQNNAELDKLDHAINQLTSLLEAILGVP